MNYEDFTPADVKDFYPPKLKIEYYQNQIDLLQQRIITMKNNTKVDYWWREQVIKWLEERIIVLNQKLTEAKIENQNHTNS